MLAGAGLAALLALTGCASHAPVAHDEVGVMNLPAKVRLKQFARTELKAVIPATSANTREVDQLARTLDVELAPSLTRVLRRLEVVPRGVPLERKGGRVLQIEPVLTEAHIVRPIDRELFTWGAGDASLVLQVTFRDAESGEVLAEPVFCRKSDGWVGSWSGGATDREVVRLIGADVAVYAQDNY